MAKVNKGLTNECFRGIPIVILATFVISITGAGQGQGLSVSINSMIEDFGFSRSKIALGYTIGTVTGGYSPNLYGPLLDKYGAQRVGMITLLAFGLACIILSLARNWYTLTFAFFCLRSTAGACLNLACTFVTN